MNVLEGIKVLDLSRYISGPYCCKLLGDFGADVVKVEPPTGETVRWYEPAINGTSFYYMAFNYNKRSVTLNTRSDAGKLLLEKMILDADVLVENYKPGTMEAMGFSWERIQSINPRLIMVSISGFGQTGPMAGRPGFDFIAQAMSGLMHMTGSPESEPYVSGTFIIDYTTAIYSAFAVLAAVIARERTGKGQRIEASLLQTAGSLLIDAVPEDLLLNRTRKRIGNNDKNTAPVGCFKTKDDEYVFLVASPQAHWEIVAHTIGHPELIEDSRFKTIPVRHAHTDEVNSYVARWIQQYNRDEVVETFTRNGVPVAPVLSISEFIRLPQVAHNQQIIDIPLADGRTVPIQGMPFKMSDTPGQVRMGAPDLGQHNNEILTSLGYSKEEIINLRESGAI